MNCASTNHPYLFLVFVFVMISCFLQNRIHYWRMFCICNLSHLGNFYWRHTSNFIWEYNTKALTLMGICLKFHSQTNECPLIVEYIVYWESGKSMIIYVDSFRIFSSCLLCGVTIFTFKNHYTVCIILILDIGFTCG